MSFPGCLSLVIRVEIENLDRAPSLGNDVASPFKTAWPQSQLIERISCAKVTVNACVEGRGRCCMYSRDSSVGRASD